MTITSLNSLLSPLKPPTPLVGRDNEVAALVELMRRGPARLLTLCGPAGVGKTRLALEAADLARESFPGGVVVVALAGVRDPALVAPAIAQAAGLRESGSQPVLDSLIAALRAQRTLLLLDNFEHVGAAAPLLGDLLAASPRLTMVVTSRSLLGVPGEYAVPVQPLALPDPQRAPSPESLLHYPATELFVQRARAVNPAFASAPEMAPTIAAICQHLDGLPLAIELAAAWAAFLSPQALLTRLDRRLSVLMGGAADLPERLQTLRSAIAWSYDLLTPAEQVLFRRLAVFVGGCTLDAIEGLYDCLDGPRDGAAAGGFLADRVASLAAKSLLHIDINTPPPTSRITVLETIREYAAERLAAHGEASTTHRAHLNYYVALAEATEPQLRGKEQALWLARLDEDDENLRAALEWAHENGEAELGLRLAAALWRFWWIRGHLGTGRGWLEDLLVLDARRGHPTAPAVRAKALVAAGLLCCHQGNYGRAVEACTEGLTLARELGDKAEIVLALYVLALAAKDRGEYERAATLGEEGLAAARELGDPWNIMLALHNLGEVAREQGAYAQAIAWCDESAALARDLGDSGGLAAALDTLGTAARERGDAARAATLYEESLALRRDLEDRQGIAAALDNLGNVACDQEEYLRAAALYGESLALRRELGDKLGIAISLDNLANTAREQGDYARATELAEESLTLRRDLADRWGTALSLLTLGSVLCDQGDFRGALPLYLESLSLAQVLGKKQGTASCLEGLAAVAWAVRQAERAAQLCGAAAALREASDTALRPADRRRHEHTVVAARVPLGDGPFAAAWATGAGMTLEEAIGTALALGEPSTRHTWKRDVHRSIFEAIADGVIVTNLHTGLVVEVNAAACRMLGYAHDELVGIYPATFIHPDYQHFLGQYVQAIAAGDDFQAQVLLQRKDGAPIPVEVHGAAFTYRGGPHALGVLRNVSERVQAEEQIWEKEVQYRGVFEATSDGLVITDLDGHIVEANPAMCRMHGYTHDEFVQLYPTDFIHPDYHPAFADYMRAISAGGSYHTRAVDVRKDGTPFHVDVHGVGFTYRGRPHVLGVVRDITEQVQAYELLEQRVAERTHELSTLLDVSHNVASTLELEPLLGLILDQLAAVVEYSGAAIHTLDGTTLTVVDYRGPLPREHIVGLQVPLASDRPEYRVIHERTPVILDDVQGETALIRAYSARWPVEPERDTGYIHSWLGLPLLLKERLIGMMVMAYRDPAHYTPRHAQLAMAIANQAAIAIENARLYGQAQAIAVLEERQRLARELHDSVSQALYGIALGARTARTLLDRDPAQATEPLDYVLSLAEAGLAEMRALILELRPEALQTDGLVAALEKQTAAIQARHGIAVEATLGREPEAPIAAKEALYRIAQEALHNTVKHARAQRVEVRLSKGESELTLEVRDDGEGFDPDGSFPGHLGLQTMRERATRLGGTIEVASAPARGTLVRARIPYQTPTG